MRAVAWSLLGISCIKIQKRRARSQTIKKLIGVGELGEGDAADMAVEVAIGVGTGVEVAPGVEVGRGVEVEAGVELGLDGDKIMPATE